MFRGKESSNRIELSRLVQDLLNFVVFSSLQLWGWGGGWMGVGGGWGVPSTNMHMHTHAHTCVHGKHDNFMQMAASIGFLGNPWEFLMMSYVRACMCVCVHACMCMCVGVPPHHPPPTSTHPPTPRGDPRNQSKFNSTWTNQDISILFKDLKSVETPPLMSGCIIWWVGGWVGWWVGSVQITKNLKIVDLIKIIQFCLKIYDL